MKKRALCVGVANYPEAPLRNPLNDAQDLAGKLSSLGFHCEVLVDPTNAQLDEALKKFREDLKDCELGLFFFAGHGMQIEGENYLIATNTDLGTESDAKFSSLALNKVIDALEKGANSTSIIILDACRNNPFERRWRRADTLGLAPVYAPRGTIIAFATSPGQVALDGSGRNGAFTSALLQHIDVQNITIEDLFKRVRNSLSAATSGKQTSWEHTSLMGDFFFNLSILTGELVTEYSPAAKADAQFVSENADASRLINQLRSHNWYEQNPVFNLLDADMLKKFAKDDLFVLGRNIYQAACGQARGGIDFFAALERRLSSLGSELSFHLLNGVLYEIYFDHQDRFRRVKKTELLDEVFALEDDARFDPSFSFIRQALSPYIKELFYLPGNKRHVVFNVGLGGTDTVTVERILFEGHDVFFANDGVTLVSNAQAAFWTTVARGAFERALVSEAVVPTRRLKMFYSAQPSPSEVRVPFDYNVLRISSNPSPFSDDVEGTEGKRTQVAF